MTILKTKWRLPVVLFLATFCMTTLIQGWMYGIAIMTILLAHELGHFWMCKKYGIETTYPLFIPMPNILGTMGAVISMKSSIPNRRALFDIGVAGPLLGLLVAIPAIVFGLHFSEVKAVSQDGVGLFLGEPLLFSWLSHWIKGPIPQGYDILLHPVAFAGWAMLFVTSINLFPIGQLDGGHIAHAMLGPIAKWVSWGTAILLAYLGYQYHPMWYIFAAIILLFAFRHPETLNETQSVGMRRLLVGVLAFLLLAICFAPLPFEFRAGPSIAVSDILPIQS